jgi:hypothetical protein
MFTSSSARHNGAANHPEDDPGLRMGRWLAIFIMIAAAAGVAWSVAHGVRG